MKKTHGSLKSRAFLLILLFVGSIAQATFAQQSDKPFSLNESPLPAPTGFVNDYAGVIDAATKQQLEAKIKAFRDKWNPPIELGVAIVKTTGERPIFDYSLAVSRGWKLGSKQDDNPSALLLVAVDDRKYYTQVSKDLEDELPDGVVGQLQRQYLVPAFKQGNYSKGVADTIDSYIKTIEAKQTGQPAPDATPITGESKRTGGRGGGLPFGNCMTCLIILFVIMIIIFSRGGRGGGGGGFGRRNRYGGGGFGSALPWIIGSSIINSGGSSSSGWGGSSSSGDSGGGFGGFGGGGDFGGGGAGGDW